MGRRAPTAANLEGIRRELSSFLEAFDADDAEDVQVRTEALISSMVKAGVLKDSGNLKGFNLHAALERVQLPVPNREAVVARAEMFHDLVGSYGGEPDEADMKNAEKLLHEIARALESAIDVTIRKKGLE